MVCGTHADMKAASFKYIEVFHKRKRQPPARGYRSPIPYLKQWTGEKNQKIRDT